MPPAVKEIRALSRGVKVVETLCKFGACSLADLNRETGLPKSTLRRILLTFQQANFLRCSLADGLYRSNIHVPSYADTAANPSIGRVVAAALPVLKELARKVVWPSDLMVRDGLQLRIVDTNRALTPLFIGRSEIGDHVDILNTAVGRAYLAFCPRTERDEIIRQIRNTRRTQELTNLPRILNETRERGYAERDSKFTGSTDRYPFLADRLYAIAVPILAQGQVLGCINLLWPRNAMASIGDKDAMVKMLQRSVAVIAHNYETAHF
jgi:IclR family mhp operon transcriptional activator